MHLLGFLITGFSISITALLPEISDETALARLTLLDPPLSSSSSLNPTTSDNEPSSLNVNLDLLPFQNPDIPDLIAFNPKIAQEPSADSADQPSIINPSTMHAEAQIFGDDSNEICYPRSSTGRKRKKRQSCINLSQYLFPPSLPNPNRNQVEVTEGARKMSEVSVKDKEWVLKQFPNDMSEEQRGDELMRLGALGTESCASQDTKSYPFPLCCLGPERFISVPTLGPLLDTVRLMNVYNCLLFLLGRPFCLKKYCCRKVGFPEIGSPWIWGFKGVGCIEMPELVIPRL